MRAIPDLQDALTRFEEAFNLARQANRVLRLSFPKNDAPAGVLLVANRLDADEGLSKDFQFTVEVLSDRPDIQLKDLMGKMVTIELTREDGSLRGGVSISVCEAGGGQPVPRGSSAGQFSYYGVGLVKRSA